MIIKVLGSSRTYCVNLEKAARQAIADPGPALGPSSMSRTSFPRLSPAAAQVRDLLAPVVTG